MAVGKILLGVTGSIAAYKAAYIIRFFIKSGAEVKVIMSPDATKFIAPLTLSTISRNPVFVGLTNEATEEWNNHIKLAHWADVLLVAPATANTISKFAHGLCDNILSAVYLSAVCPVYIAPAMDRDMLLHPSVKANLDILKTFGNTIIYPQFGELASGLIGEGRMEEPEIIFRKIMNDSGIKTGTLNNKNILITAGPTYESIDPVRYIANHSTGKMGYAIANEFAERGARVTLISGPTDLNLQHPNICLVSVTDAAEMHESVVKNFKECDIAILAAAVADYKPVKTTKNKIKKNDKNIFLELTNTIDILSELGKLKTKKQVLAGFSLETENEIKNAKQKLKSKNLDFIILNSLNDKGAGFKHDTNKISIIDRNNIIKSFELKHKSQVAKDIVEKTLSFLNS